MPPRLAKCNTDCTPAADDLPRAWQKSTDNPARVVLASSDDDALATHVQPWDVVARHTDAIGGPWAWVADMVQHGWMAERRGDDLILTFANPSTIRRALRATRH